MNSSPTLPSPLPELIRELVDERRALPAPRATYRLQFNHTFTFRQARDIVPYLSRLGVSHVYASPIFRAVAGSLHGYDVVDYNEINPDIGSREEFDAFVSTLHEHDMRLIVDFVPNHMGIDGGVNPWWQDVVENGPMSRYANHFDIDWTPLKQELRNKVLLPFLGGQYGEILERGELKLAFEDGRFTVYSWETPFPLDPRTYPFILSRLVPALVDEVGAEHLDVLDLESIATALDRLPGPDDADGPDDAIAARHREQVGTVRRLADLCERSDPVRAALEREVQALNGTPGDARSFDDLDHLLNLQPFRLAYWRVAAEEINYRRFFAINTLAAIRQEEEGVFEETHRTLLDLLASGAIGGVRIDHPDGLWDPAGYFRQVQAAHLREVARARLAPESDEAWEAALPEVCEAIAAELDRIAADDREWPLYVVGEKILEHGEVLPADWAVAGTVGYEFAQVVTGLFVDPEARALFDRITARFTGDKVRFPELVYDMKHQMMREAFPSEVNVLTNILNRISERDRHSRDFTRNNLRAALLELIACFPVYRTYTTCADGEVNDRDRGYIQGALALTKRRNASLDASVFDFVEAVLLLHGTDNPRERLDQRCHFAMKLQQLSGPVMAKGLEDTAFYRFNRLVSLNEVGGDPSRFGSGVDEFHRQSRARRRQWPQAMLTSSTHDTKRSEDVRARISVLSEVPTEWRAALNRWSRQNRKLKKKIEGALAPHRADEYVLYQVLIGSWPLEGVTASSRSSYAERLQDYMVKVARESGRFTTWVNPNEPYEEALTAFAAGLLDARRSKTFQADFRDFMDTVVEGGLVNGLAQQVLKLTAPGVPDIYQGTELWDDSLVDPDNRRPVDFGHRQRLLDEATGSAMVTYGTLRDPVTKLALSTRLLRLRSACPDIFSDGEYRALDVQGPAASHVVAFARRTVDTTVLVAVPRLLTKLARERGLAFTDPGLWDGTIVALPAEVDPVTALNVVTGAPVSLPGGAELPVATLFGDSPVAVVRFLHEGADTSGS